MKKLVIASQIVAVALLWVAAPSHTQAKEASVLEALQDSPSGKKGNDGLVFPKEKSSFLKERDDSFLLSDDEGGTTRTKNSEGLPWGKMIFSVGALISLMVVVAQALNRSGKAVVIRERINQFLAKSNFGKRFASFTSTSNKSLKRIPLGLRSEIVVVEVEGLKLIVGVGAGHISLLHSSPIEAVAQTQDANGETSISEESQNLSERIRTSVEKMKPFFTVQKRLAQKRATPSFDESLFKKLASKPQTAAASEPQKKVAEKQEATNLGDTVSKNYKEIQPNLEWNGSR